MKTSICLLLVFFFIPVFNLSAQDIAPTTEEEYNYCTKGYKIQVESGLDMKKGYEIWESIEFNDGSYYFDFKILARSEKKEVAAILVVAKSKGSGNTYYLCIPRNNNALTLKYYTVLDTWDGSICRAYAKATSTHLARAIAIGNQLEKKLKSKNK